MTTLWNVIFFYVIISKLFEKFNQIRRCDALVIIKNIVIAFINGLYVTNKIGILWLKQAAPILCNEKIFDMWCLSGITETLPISIQINFLANNIAFYTRSPKFYLTICWIVWIISFIEWINMFHFFNQIFVSLWFLLVYIQFFRLPRINYSSSIVISPILKKRWSSYSTTRVTFRI